jgi:hypothetical protein
VHGESKGGLGLPLHRPVIEGIDDDRNYLNAPLEEWREYLLAVVTWNY